MIIIAGITDIFKIVAKSVKKLKTISATNLQVKMSPLDKALNNIFKIATIKKAVETITSNLIPEISGADMEYMINEALMEIVPVQFEGVMIGLRVKYTLDSQLYGLALALSDYIDIDLSDILDAGAFETIDIENAIYNAVEDQISNISDMEGICKNFWNEKDLEEFM